MTENTLIALSVGIVLNLIILAWKNRKKGNDNEEGYDLGFNNGIDDEHNHLDFDENDENNTKHYHDSDLNNDINGGDFDFDLDFSDDGGGDD